tara:strand:+ start:12427 stop:12813 length:387 start_codon:yes stop_codon:yes gene_type:complete
MEHILSIENITPTAVAKICDMAENLTPYAGITLGTTTMEVRHLSMVEAQRVTAYARHLTPSAVITDAAHNLYAVTWDDTYAPSSGTLKGAGFFTSNGFDYKDTDAIAHLPLQGTHMCDDGHVRVRRIK